MAARVIGIGREWSGDDGVGIAVVRMLRELDARCDLVELEEPSRLIELLTGGADPVVLVDAVLDQGPPGRVLLIGSEARGAHSDHPLSTHGVGVMEAIELARIAHPEQAAKRIFIVGITIRETSGQGQGLSAAVEAAVAQAAAQALRLAGS